MQSRFITQYSFWAKNQTASQLPYNYYYPQLSQMNITCNYANCYAIPHCGQLYMHSRVFLRILANSDGISVLNTMIFHYYSQSLLLYSILSTSFIHNTNNNTLYCVILSFFMVFGLIQKFLSIDKVIITFIKIDDKNLRSIK